MLQSLTLSLLLLLPAAQSEGERNGDDAAGRRRAIAPTDLAALVEVSAVEVAHDGSFAVVALRRIAGDPGRRGAGEAVYADELQLFDLRAERPGPRSLTRGEARAPALAPDGSRLAFLRPGERATGGDPAADETEGVGKNQVWVLPLDGPGEAVQWSRVEGGVVRVVWAPDAKGLYLWRRRSADELDGPAPFDRERPNPWPGPPATVDGEVSRGPSADGPSAAGPSADGPPDEAWRWLEAGRGERDPSVHFDLLYQDEQSLGRGLQFGEVEFLGGADEPTRPVLTGWRDHGGAELSPDGSAFAFLAPPPGSDHPQRELRLALWRVPSEGGEAELLLDDPQLDPRALVWSEDGARIALAAGPAGDRAYGQVGLVEFDVATRVATPRSAELDRSVGQVSAWGPARWAARVEDSGDSAVHIFPRGADEGGALFGRAGEQVLQFGSGGGRLVVAYASPEDPCRLALVEPSGARRELHAWHAEFLLGVHVVLPEAATATSNDGTPVPYWVLPPRPRADGQPPRTLLSLHGGPAVMWGPASRSMWHEWQLFAARGYGVVFVNPRGSSGYGRAFQAANWRDWGAGPAADALAALDDAKLRYDWIDGAQLYLTGGSYAGYLTAWIVAHDRRFRAAAAQRGVYHLPTAFGEANAWRLLERHFGPYPWDDDTRAALEADSPFNRAEGIHTPLLILHASQDLRTGVSQSEMLYRALKVLGRPVEYVRFPEEGHELSRSGAPRRRVDRLLRLLDWFERFGADPANPVDLRDPAREPK